MNLKKILIVSSLCLGIAVLLRPVVVSGAARRPPEDGGRFISCDKVCQSKGFESGYCTPEFSLPWWKRPSCRPGETDIGGKYCWWQYTLRSIRDRIFRRSTCCCVPGEPEPTPTPTLVPTATPTVVPTPTSTPMPTATPTPLPIPCSSDLDCPVRQMCIGGSCVSCRHAGDCPINSRACIDGSCQHITCTEDVDCHNSPYLDEDWFCHPDYGYCMYGSGTSCSPDVYCSDTQEGCFEGKCTSCNSACDASGWDFGMCGGEFQNCSHSYWDGGCWYNSRSWCIHNCEDTTPSPAGDTCGPSDSTFHCNCYDIDYLCFCPYQYPTNWPYYDASCALSGCYEDDCSNGKDDDLDKDVDCADSDCDGRDGCEYGTELTCDDGVDNDCDTLTDCDDLDCDGDVCAPNAICSSSTCSCSPATWDDCNGDVGDGDSGDGCECDVSGDNVCYGEVCCTPESESTTCSGKGCGTVINNCGQEVNCGSCSLGTCNTGVCQYKDCDASCNCNYVDGDYSDICSVNSDCELACNDSCDPLADCCTGSLVCTDTGGADYRCRDSACPEETDCACCIPDCTGLECGPDPICGVECGPCIGGGTCNIGVCQYKACSEESCIWFDGDVADECASDPDCVIETYTCLACDGTDCVEQEFAEPCVDECNTCTSLGCECGTHNNGCGGTIDCGDCLICEVCDGCNCVPDICTCPDCNASGECVSTEMCCPCPETPICDNDDDCACIESGVCLPGDVEACCLSPSDDPPCVFSCPGTKTCQSDCTWGACEGSCAFSDYCPYDACDTYCPNPSLTTVTNACGFDDDVCYDCGNCSSPGGLLACGSCTDADGCDGQRECNASCCWGSSYRANDS